MSETAPPGRLTRAQLLAEVTQSLSASLRRKRGLRLGLEAELIPLHADGGGRVPLDAPAPGTASLRGLLGAVAEREGWTEDEGTGGPRATIPEVGVVTFEPGGQLEIATVPFSSVDGLVEAVHRSLAPLFSEAEAQGIRLVARGMDPENDVDGAPLVLTTERHRRQRAHYDELGPWGARMMVLSAALHVNVDLGGRAVRRWWVSNRMAALLTALFANAPRELDDGSTVRSWRAEQWRHLDPSRTGLFGDEMDPAGEYLGFALDALDFLGAGEGGESRPFRVSWDAGVDLDAWRRHLSTLFPEVRPRGYLELRSVDALRPAWYAVPLVLVAGILYDPMALGEAQRLLPRVDSDLLLRAGRGGLADAEVAEHATAFFDLALAGAARLGGTAVGEASMEAAHAYRERFVAMRLDPGSEPEDLNPFVF